MSGLGLRYRLFPADGRNWNRGDGTAGAGELQVGKPGADPQHPQLNFRFILPERGDHTLGAEASNAHPVPRADRAAALVFELAELRAELRLLGLDRRLSRIFQLGELLLQPL